MATKSLLAEILTKNKFNIIKEIIFPDHYKYTQNDINNIQLHAKNLNAKIITTEKDYVKINLNKDNDIKSTIFPWDKDEKKLIACKITHMKLIKYFIQFLIISTLFLIFKILL